MAQDYWANCTLCEKNTFKKFVVPVCLYCGKTIQNFYFDEKCMSLIYNTFTYKINSEYNKLKIICLKCKDHNHILCFDSIDD